MPSRHEQVRAHRFVTRRIVSAMLSGEPESTELPARRLAMALFGSLIVATIVLAVVGVIGFVNPTGGKPEENDIIIMRETGARFVYVEGTLHPVLNYASALLIVGTPISGRRAYEVGLVGHVTPAGGALAQARDIAEQVAANGPLAVRNIKASVIENLEKTEAEAFPRELELGMAVMASADAKEGPRAFLEKRPPNFTGK